MEEIHRLEKKNYCLVRGLPWSEEENGGEMLTNIEIQNEDKFEVMTNDAPLSTKRSGTEKPKPTRKAR